VLVSFSVVAHAADLPRYVLPVGRVLEYSLESTSKEKGSPDSISRATARLIVLGENPDGSRRVVVRMASSYSHQGAQGMERINLNRVDLHPEGRCTNDDSAMPGSGARFLPQLPANDAEASGQWSGDDPSDQSTVSYRFKSDQGGDYVFTADTTGPMSRIYVTTDARTYHFDRAKGLIISAETTGSQGYGFNSASTGTMKLTKVDIMEPVALQTLRKDYDTWFEASRQYQALMRKISDEPQDTPKLLSEAKAVLDAASKNVSVEEVKQEAARKLQEHEQYASYSIEEGKRVAAVLNKPAPDWSAKDMAGNEFSAKSLAGKVVVMDFWYRGCGWCMYAMPQVRQLAADYKDKPVVVLGMNTDRDQADAQFVIKEFDLKYPTLKATGIPEKFGVQGFPTLVIIDQQGVVRGFHVGYSPDLHETVSKKIDDLLKATPSVSIGH
jgi:thiol-disulfide isomerase/thioredoxin